MTQYNWQVADILEYGLLKSNARENRKSLQKVSQSFGNVPGVMLSERNVADNML